MSESEQPPVPPTAHLPAAPQYPTVPFPHARQAAPAVAPAPAPAPAPGHFPPQPYADTGNPLGVTAFVIAVATLAVNLFSSLARPLVYGGDGGFEFMLVLDNGIGFLSFFAYVVALVLGLIAARRSSARLLTGIAIGVAGVGAAGLVFTALAIGVNQYL